MSITTIGREIGAKFVRRRRERTFSRGIDLPHYKYFTDSEQTRRIPTPPVVVIPLKQHTGRNAEPIVSVGEHVSAGQKIGDLDEKWCSAVHASVAGKVTHIEPRPFGDGTLVPSVVISADPHQPPSTFRERPHWRDLGREQVLAILKECGIVGMAGAGFPTHINVDVREKVPTLIINGTECEPFLTSDHRTMLERTDAVLGGARILAALIGADHCYFGIETNKPDAIELFTDKTRDLADFSVVPLAVKYPQGYKKTLLRAITGKEPPLGGRSADVGCIVRNISTTAAIYDAVAFGKPLFERIVTVSGPDTVPRPGNYLVPVGTPIDHILESVGVSAGDLNGYKIIRGGPMTGLAIDTLAAPIVKASTAVLVMPASMIQEERPEISPCIRCSACVKHCPVGLYPSEISQLVEAGVPEAAEALHIMECCECAICSYVCPAYRPVSNLVMDGKAILRQRATVE